MAADQIFEQKGSSLKRESCASAAYARVPLSLAEVKCSGGGWEPSPRQIIADRRLRLQRLLHRRPRYHAVVMRIEVRIGAAVRVQRIDKPPEQPEQVDIGDRIAIDGPLAAAKALFGEPEDLAPAIVAGAAGRVDRRGDKRHPRIDSGFDLDFAVLLHMISVR